MLTEIQLDDLLDGSLPSFAHEDDCQACRSACEARTPGVQAWTRRGSIAAAAAAGVLAVGAGAAATVGLPSEGTIGSVTYTQLTSAGTSCFTTFSVEQVDTKSPAPVAIAAAREALATLELASLDLTDELKDVLAQNTNASWHGPGARPDFFYATDSRALAENAALSQAVYDALIQQLFMRGVPTNSIALKSESLCDDAADDFGQTPS